jgi:hypothetical protein
VSGVPIVVLFNDIGAITKPGVDITDVASSLDLTVRNNLDAGHQPDYSPRFVNGLSANLHREYDLSDLVNTAQANRVSGDFSFSCKAAAYIFQQALKLRQSGTCDFVQINTLIGSKN